MRVHAEVAEGVAPVAYLTKRFPRLSETFILDEILGLEAAGVPLRLFAIADPGEAVVQPDVSRVASPVSYLRSGTDRRSVGRDYLGFARSHAVLVRRRPRQWFALVAHILVARRHVMTMKRFLEAGPLAVELERTGARHIHAAFAHGPATIAHFVHLLTGIPFSFAAHAKDLYLSTPDILAMKAAASSFVLVCSSSAADELRRVVASQPDPAISSQTTKVILAPHGVDTERFVPATVTGRVGTASSVLRILAVGRLVPKKGYPVLLAALGILAATEVDFECRIVGGGDLRAELAELTSSLGLAERVRFCGSMTQQEIVEEYRHAEVFVQASVVTADGDRDGIPNSVMEAMASGVAVVASTVAGIPEVVHDGHTGVLVAPGDPAALAAGLRALATDPGLRRRLGGAAHRYAAEHLSRRSCIELVAALLTRGPFPASAPVAAEVA